MPIGKSAIKRVADNGYSKVKTAAPDMENSTVIAKPDPQVEEKLLPKTEAAPAVKKPAAKKAPAKKAPAKPAQKTAVAKKPAAKPQAAKKPTEKKEVKKDGFVRVSLGGDLPTYLL